MPTIHVRLNQEEYAGLKNYAKLKSVNESELVRQALNQMRTVEVSLQVLGWDNIVQSKLVSTLMDCMKRCVDEAKKDEEFIKEFKEEIILQVIDRAKHMEKPLLKISDAKRKRGRPPMSKKEPK